MTTAADRHRARVVELTVLGHDGPTIAEQVKLSLRQVRRYLADPAIRQQIRELEAERLHTVARKAASLGGSAVAVLATIANDADQPAAARVSAARGLLDTMVKVGELAALEERVAALEDGLTKGDAGWKPSAV
jgi:hypothetical protein